MFARLPSGTIQLLNDWKAELIHTADSDFIFTGRRTKKTIGRSTILANFKKGLDDAELKGSKNLLHYSSRHTFNSCMLDALLADVVREFTGHSTEQTGKHYYHPY